MGHRNWRPAFQSHAGLRVTLVDKVACAVFTLAALCGYAQLQLDIVKTLALASEQGNLFIRHAMTNANNHWKESGEK